MTVYQITKTLIENHDAILEVYPALSCWTVEGSADPELVGGVDFYPGALRYYQEAGLIGGGEAAAPAAAGLGLQLYMVTLGGRLSKVTGTLTGSVLVTAIGCFMQWIGVGEHLNFTIIGSIMPLIPGAGVYWTIHYLVANDLSMALQTGFTAVKMAIAIVFGIVLAFELPQKLFTPQKK